MLNKKKMPGPNVVFSSFQSSRKCRILIFGPRNRENGRAQLFVSDVCRKAATTAIKIEREKIEEEVTTHLLLH